VIGNRGGRPRDPHHSRRRGDEAQRRFNLEIIEKVTSSPRRIVRSQGRDGGRQLKLREKGPASSARHGLHRTVERARSVRVGFRIDRNSPF